METSSTMFVKCKHINCNREAVDNGYCKDCIQLPHLHTCNYCSGISRNKKRG